MDHGILLGFGRIDFGKGTGAEQTDHSRKCVEPGSSGCRPFDSNLQEHPAVVGLFERRHVDIPRVGDDTKSV